MIKKFIIISYIFLINTQYSHAELTQFKPSFPQFTQPVKERLTHNQIYTVGLVKFNMGSVQGFGVTALDPIDDSIIKLASASLKNGYRFKFELPPYISQQLKLFIMPGFGPVLVPKDWTDIQLNVGVNGTALALIMSPDHQSFIELYQSGACVGCGLPYATLFFPALLKESLENDFGGYTQSKNIHIVRPNKNTAFFSYSIANHYKVEGVAKFDHTDYHFEVIRVSLAPAQHHLATPILNFFNTTD